MGKKDILTNVVIPFFIGIGIYYVISLLFHPYIVSGSSMVPTFYDSDLVICGKVHEDDTISYGEIIVFSDHVWWKKLVKRVVAVPGDTVEIKDGLLYVNDTLSLYQFEEMANEGSFSYPIVLKEDEYFCLGDNRNNSRDSRTFGPVKKENIKYKVKKRILHFKKGET